MQMPCPQQKNIFYIYLVLGYAFLTQLKNLCLYAKAKLGFVNHFISNTAFVCLCKKNYFKQSRSLALYEILFFAKALHKMES